MATPAIALRFRDTTPGVNTIEAHRAIIGREGAVWWGWWKKEFEDDHLTYLSTSELNGPIEILIVDRSTSRMFRSSAVRWSIGNTGEVDLGRVPEYYREYAPQVFGWFLLTSIEETDFVEDIARKFGDHTLVQINGLDSSRADKIAASTSARDRSCVLHLSDLHFGADYDFITQMQRPKIGDLRRTLTDCLVTDLRRIGVVDDIAAVIVTGDFTTAGNWGDQVRSEILQEFEALRAALKLERQQIIAVPGNHDIIRYPKDANINASDLAVGNQTSYQHEREFRTFVDELVGRSWQESLNYVQRLSLRDADALICVLNSCTILATEWTEYGYVGNSGLDAIRELRAESVNRSTFKIMALHHHLLPVTGVEAPSSRGVTLSLDASDLLDEAQQAGVHVALHGHQHMPRLARYQTIPLMGRTATHPLHVVSNGSAGVAGTRRPGSERNTYCVFRLNEASAHLWMRELRPDCKEGATLYEGDLDISPANPSSIA
jgi:3',5'-cyclic AMP phosphodiesterase CpdA